MKKFWLSLIALLVLGAREVPGERVYIFQERDGSKGKAHHLTLEDMNLHPAESFWYTESYFFIVYFESGEVAYLNLIISNMGLKKNQPALTLTIITPDRKRLTTEKDFLPEDLRLGEKTFSLRIGDNILYGDDKNLKLKVHQEKLGLELEFSSPVSGFKLGDGCAWFGEKREIYFCINYPVPRARAVGTIFYQGKKVLSQGWGYVDHSWYNADTTEFEKVWHNLKFFSQDQTLILTSFLTTEKYGEKTIGLSALVNDQTLLMATTELSITESQWEFDPVGKKNYPGRIQFEFHHPEYSGKINFDSSRLIEKMDVLEKLDKGAPSKALKWAIQTFKAKPYYYRSFGTTELELSSKSSKSKIPGQASCEVIFVK